MFDLSVIINYLIKGLVLVTALPVHEAAHAYVANKLGDPTGKYQGRISLNPAKHLDLLGSISLILLGFGWARPVQINARNFKNPKVGMAISALAGPVSNILMATIALILAKVCFYLSLLYSINLFSLQYIFNVFVQINLGLAVFNLIPIPPLDGSRVLNLFLKQETYFKIMQYERYSFIILILLVATPILNTPIIFLRNIFYTGIDFITGFVDILFKLV